MPEAPYIEHEPAPDIERDPYETIRQAIERLHTEGDYTRAELATTDPLLTEINMMRDDPRFDIDTLKAAYLMVEYATIGFARSMRWAGYP